MLLGDGAHIVLLLWGWWVLGLCINEFRLFGWAGSDGRAFYAPASIKPICFTKGLKSLSVNNSGILCSMQKVAV